MVLQVDTSAPLLRPSQLTALVGAVRDAEDHDENCWIEWKSTLDLTASAGHVHLVKHILGLANRDPAAASHRAGGYGYLLVGVEPGQVHGVTSVDPETLVGQVRVYVGHEVRWVPEYIEVDGKQVLVVIVDPPQPGDPIHSLRKQLTTFTAGAIFVRHAGRTDQANPADLEMLQARLLARTASLEFAVTAVPPFLEVTPDILRAVEQWVEQRRPVLLKARYQPPTPRREASVRFDFPMAKMYGPFPPTVKQDTRTAQEYKDAVANFLDDAKDVLADRGLWDLYRHAPAQLHLSVHNTTDLGYTGIRLAVHLPGNVTSYPEDLTDTIERNRPYLPPPPTPLGTPTITPHPMHAALTNNFGNDYGRLMPPSVIMGRPGRSGPAFKVTDTGSVTINYREFELRPGETVNLDPVPLLIHESPGTALTATWSATAAQMKGRPSGELTITIIDSSLDIHNLDQAKDTDH